MSRRTSLPSTVDRVLIDHGIDRERDTLLVAVSGGLDSTTLARVAHELGYRVALAHCNYRLRGEDSEADEQFVRDIAVELEVACHIWRADTEPDRNLQEWARNMRYLYFKKILNEYNYTILLTAHHLNDNLETVLLNFIKGTGLRGLRGIPLYRSLPYSILRPMLDISRDEIHSFAIHRGFVWREDVTNMTDAYLRNRIRHNLIDKLRKFGLSNITASRTLSHLRAAETFYTIGLDTIASICFDTNPTGRVEFDRTLAAKYTIDEQIILLRHRTEHMLFTNEQYRQMLETKKALELHTKTHSARVSEHAIEFLPQVDYSAMSYTIASLPYRLEVNGHLVRLERVTRPASLDQPNAQHLMLLRLPLRLRPRQEGDRFRPLGMRGSKKVKDYLIDEKIPPWERDGPLVLTDAEGCVVALLGHRIDDRYRVRDEDEYVLRILTTKMPRTTT